jgi:Tol biopolymer transport system component
MNRMIDGFNISKLVPGCLVSLVFLPMAWSGTSSGRMESVSVSPDGKVIAVDFVKDKTSHIYLIAVDTGNATRLTHTNSAGESNLTFSPDGEPIAYTYFPEDNAPSRLSSETPMGQTCMSGRVHRIKLGISRPFRLLRQLFACREASSSRVGFLCR